MQLTRITLDQFRRYEHLSMALPEAGLRIEGRNASGKSSFLEALLLLATTKSPRVSTERDLIRWGSGVDYGLQPYARISARVVTASGEHLLEIRLEASAANDALTRKTCLVDGKNVRASTMVGLLKVVEFSPEDVQIVGGPPADRRRQLDVLISQIDRHYMQTGSRFAKVLTQRNGLLRSFQRDGVSWRSRTAVEQLSFWDDELVTHGARMITTRARVVQALNAQVQRWSGELLQRHSMSLWLVSGVPHLDALLEQYASDPNLEQRVLERFAREIEQARPEDFRRGSTSIGPQRDDLVMMLDGRPLAAFGSRGQQRLGVIALKLSEADVIHEMTGELPVLLLDDALSELDADHSSWLLRVLASSDRQVFLTSAVEGALDHAELEHLETMTLETVSAEEDTAGSL